MILQLFDDIFSIGHIVDQSLWNSEFPYIHVFNRYGAFFRHAASMIRCNTGPFWRCFLPNQVNVIQVHFISATFSSTKIFFSCCRISACSVRSSLRYDVLLWSSRGNFWGLTRLNATRVTLSCFYLISTGQLVTQEQYSFDATESSSRNWWSSRSVPTSPGRPCFTLFDQAWPFSAASRLANLLRTRMVQPPPIQTQI